MEPGGVRKQALLPCFVWLAVQPQPVDSASLICALPKEDEDLQLPSGLAEGVGSAVCATAAQRKPFSQAGPWPDLAGDLCRENSTKGWGERGAVSE